MRNAEHGARSCGSWNGETATTASTAPESLKISKRIDTTIAGLHPPVAECRPMRTSLESPHPLDAGASAACVRLTRVRSANQSMNGAVLRSPS